MDQFEHAQGVLHLFRLPRIAADHRDAEHLGLRGLQQHHHRHLVGAAGPGAVLIDDHHAPRLGARGAQRPERKSRELSEYESSNHGEDRVAAGSGFIATNKTTGSLYA